MRTQLHGMIMFGGNCECERCKETEGKNLLGKALMEVRSKLK